MTDLEESTLLQEARRCLTRARGQHAILRRRLLDGLAEPACQLKVDEMADTRETLYRFRPRSQLPVDAPYLAHDAARSILRAMDAFYSAVTSTRFGALQVRRAFPFARSPADLSALAGLIRNTEPYPGGDPWIAALPEICGARADQLLEVRALGQLRIIGDGTPYASTAAIEAPAWQGQDPGLILRVRDPEGQFQARYRLTQQAVFTRPGGVAGCEVVSVLGYQADVAEGLLDTLDALRGRPGRRPPRGALDRPDTGGGSGAHAGPATPGQRPERRLSG